MGQPVLPIMYHVMYTYRTKTHVIFLIIVIIIVIVPFMFVFKLIHILEWYLISNFMNNLSLEHLINMFILCLYLICREYTEDFYC